MAICIAMLIGFVLDLIIGDPFGKFHPVILMGKLIELLDKGLYREESSDEEKKIAGGLLVFLVIMIVIGVLLTLRGVCYMIYNILGVAFDSYLCYTMFAARSLMTESMKVKLALENEGLEAGRKAVSRIVGRDTANLDEAGVTRAAVETVAESTSDGEVAPMFYMAIGGPVLAFVYKAINTMDSMVGYKNDRYILFGRAAAKLDDIANFIPARISASAMLLAARMMNFDYQNALKIYQRDRKNHASPNSAQTESVMAGALNLRLAGPAYYFGKLYDKPYIGDDNRPIEPEDIARANKLMYATSIITFAIFWAIRLAIVLSLIFWKWVLTSSIWF